MPASSQDAITFLETQWYSINDNKLKGIHAETAFAKYLVENEVHFIPGGWILTPGNNSVTDIPARHKICLLPVSHSFSWSLLPKSDTASPALLSAYNYFQQMGISAYLVEAKNPDESSFELPLPSSGRHKAYYPKPYDLSFKKIAPKGSYEETPIEKVFSKFPCRRGNTGLRCNKTGRIDTSLPEWKSPSMIRDLFWFEYARYYCQTSFLTSNNDLDLFIIGQSGSPYPVEIKSKSSAKDDALGEWFGLDIGPFAKMAFFTSNSMNTDALYVVRELNDLRNNVQWHGIKFTELVKSCSWVVQGGGQGMSGGKSATIKIPKAAFQDLTGLLKTL